MATWNSRGLRGSTLEDMINKTNEKYREHGLALIQKIPTPITPIKMDQKSRHITLAYLNRKVLSIISVQCRAFLCALMLKNVILTHFRLRTSINIRLSLCKNLKSRMESHLSLFPIHIRINIITLHTGSLSISGTGQRLVEGKASDMTNLILTSF